MWGGGKRGRRIILNESGLEFHQNLHKKVPPWSAVRFRLMRSGKHAIYSRRSIVYSTFSVSHSAEFCLFEAVYPLPFGHPLLQGGTRFTLISILRGASIFYAPYQHSSLLTPHSSLVSRAFITNQEMSRPRANPEPSNPFHFTPCER